MSNVPLPATRQRKRMSPELKAFINSIADCPADDLQEQSRAVQVLERITKRARAMLTAITKALDEIDPYTCEFRPIRRVKNALAQCRARRDAIGYHGLA